jgi:hypothetical protein
MPVGCTTPHRSFDHRLISKTKTRPTGVVERALRRGACLRSTAIRMLAPDLVAGNMVRAARERFQLFAVERIVSVPNPARSSNFDGLSFTPRTGAVSLSPGSQQPLGRPRLIRRAQLALQPATRMVGL